jgi:hypothetical protein
MLGTCLSLTLDCASTTAAFQVMFTSQTNRKYRSTLKKREIHKMKQGCPLPEIETTGSWKHVNSMLYAIRVPNIWDVHKLSTSHKPIVSAPLSTSRIPAISAGHVPYTNYITTTTTTTNTATTSTTTTLHYITLHYITLHYTNYTTLECTTQDHTTTTTTTTLHYNYNYNYTTLHHTN